MLHIAAKISWMVVCFKLFLSKLDNILIYDRAKIVFCLLMGCDIYFAALIIFAIHKYAFKDMATLPFHFLIHYPCAKVGVPEILDADRRIKVKSITHTSLIRIQQT